MDNDGYAAEKKLNFKVSMTSSSSSRSGRELQVHLNSLPCKGKALQAEEEHQVLISNFLGYQKLFFSEITSTKIS